MAREQVINNINIKYYNCLITKQAIMINIFFEEKSLSK